MSEIVRLSNMKDPILQLKSSQVSAFMVQKIKLSDDKELLVEQTNLLQIFDDKERFKYHFKPFAD